MSSILDGITRPGRQPAPPRNPAQHAPLAMHNRVHLQLVGPDEVTGQLVTKQDVVACGNIMATWGLSKLASLLGGGAMNCSDWIGGMAIGTNSATAEASGNSGLYNSTAIRDLTDASDVIEAGAMTLRCVCTFASSEPAGAAEIREIGLMGSSAVGNNNLVARKVLTGAQSVNKGASDSIQVSYDVVLTTA